MTLEEFFLNKLHESPSDIQFSDTVTIIKKYYQYTPTEFSTGKAHHKLVNAAGTNEASCQIFAFATLQELSPAHTLALFGKYYREDVLNNLSGTDHMNIRNFMAYGWSGVQFKTPPLTRKKEESAR